MTWYLPADAVIPASYAVPADYADWVGDATPDSTPTSLVATLRACSSLVYEATEGAWYVTDPATGLPTDARLVAAFRDATCAQAAAWVALGIDPLAGGIQTVAAGTATTRKIGSASITHADQEAVEAARAAAAALTELVPAARRILARVNLLDPSVFAI